MADTFTSLLSMTKPEIGASRDSWGNKMNTNMDTIDAALTRRRYEECPSSTGTASAYAVTATNVPAYYNGLSIRFYPHVVNAAGATLNVNGLGALPIYSLPSSAVSYTPLRVAEINAVNVPVEVVYTGGIWVLMPLQKSSVLGIGFAYQNGPWSTTTTTAYAALCTGSTFTQPEPGVSMMLDWSARMNVDGQQHNLGAEIALKYYTGSAWVTAGHGHEPLQLSYYNGGTHFCRQTVSGQWLFTPGYLRSDYPTLWSVTVAFSATYSGNSVDIYHYTMKATYFRQ